LTSNADFRGDDILESFLRDLRYAFRSLLKRPGFTAAAALSLGLGIGANTTVFTLVNAAFLSSIPVAEPGRVVVVYTSQRSSPGFLPISYLNYLDLRRQNDALSGLAAFQWLRPNLLYQDRPQRLFTQIVTDNYFDVLGIRPLLGRTFGPEDFAARGGSPVVFLAHSFWLSRFGGDPGIVGRRLRLHRGRRRAAGVQGDQHLQRAQSLVPDLDVRPALAPAGLPRQPELADVRDDRPPQAGGLRPPRGIHAEDPGGAAGEGVP
jgi:hypothetical protein